MRIRGFGVSGSGVGGGVKTTNELKKPRWKLLLVMMGLPWLGLAALKVVPALDQYSYMVTFAAIGAVFGSLLLGMVWLWLLSRLPWRKRGLGVGLVLLCGGLVASMVRKDGHMGDFLPQLAWRWQRVPGERLAPLEVRAAGVERYSFTTDEAGDSPRFLGKGGTNDSEGKELASDWPAQGVRELWRREVGLGWSGFAVAGDFAVTQEQRGEEEVTVAYHKVTGEVLWVHAEKARFEEAMGGIGPRATPTAYEGRVYAMGATGILVCIDGKTGSLIWRKETLADGGRKNLMWAMSCSPLVLGDKVIVTLGEGERTLAAFAVATGEPVWRSGPDRAGYGTSVMGQRDDGGEVITVFADRVTGVDPGTGEARWEWKEGFKGAPANVANPVFLGPDRVLVGIGYGVGTTMLRTARGKAPEILWQSLKLKPKFTNPVVRGERVWGLDEGRLTCLDLSDGRALWRGSSYGHGQMLGAGPVLVIQSERGEVVVVAASEVEETVVARIPALTSKTWNQPCLAGRYLLVRNDREAVCFELAEAAR